jgi:chaperonin cofactor prefoldin
MEPNIPLIEKEIKDLCEFKADMTRKFEGRDPAKTTYEFINETNLAMQHQTDKLETLNETLNTHVRDQKNHEGKLQEDLDKYQSAIFAKFDETKITMDDFIKSADKKFAPILIYKVLVWAGSIAGGVIIIGLLTLAWKAIIHVEN